MKPAPSSEKVPKKTCDARQSLFGCLALSVASLAVALSLIGLVATGYFNSDGGPGTALSDVQLPLNDNIGFVTKSPSQSPTISPFSSVQLGTRDNLSGLTIAHSSVSPSASPTHDPTSEHPTAEPSMNPSHTPSASPSRQPTGQPSTAPSASPTLSPTKAPTRKPSPNPTEVIVTYAPGKLTTLARGLLLSQGLESRVIGRKNQPIEYHDGSFSSELMHTRPDYGACFALPNGGWMYLSNSEAREANQGGVGAFTFDKDGNMIKYERILEDTTMNCGGGRTPWDTYISCEEVANNGQIYQVDPLGKRPAMKATMGRDGGRFESFAYDVRDRSKPRFFATEDHPQGALRRFTPTNPNWNDPWTMLHGNGTLEYLVLDPTEPGRGNFYWTTQLSQGKRSAQLFYPETEGIDVNDSLLYVVSKRIRQLFILDLDTLTYTNMTTVSGVFDGAPDQLKRLLVDDEDILYFTEEGARQNGVHGRNSEGQFFTILESPEYNSETTGLAFSPDGMHLYVAYQEQAKLFDIYRQDGLPFHGRSLNVNYHEV